MNNMDTSFYDINNTTTKTNIIYNMRFISFIQRLKQHFSAEIENVMKTHGDILEFADIQNKIREYIVEVQDEIDTKNNKKISNNTPYSYPDFFCIFIAIICNDAQLEKYNCLNEILEYIRKTRPLSMSGYSSNESNNEHSNIKFQCACGHICSPQNLYYIYNPETLTRLLVGCDCVKKYDIIEPVILKNVIAQSRNDENYKRCGEINEKMYKKKIIEGLLKKNETIDSLKTKYTYIGGNFGEHLEYLQVMLCGEYKNDNITEFIRDTMENDCDVCGRSNKQKLCIWNVNEEIISLCNPCNKYMKIIETYKAKICDDCGEPHKNRRDNYCNTCRLKVECDECEERKECTKSHGYNRCNECIKKPYCKNCNKLSVKVKGYMCEICYNNCYVKKCGCGTPIQSKYTKCYICNNKVKRISR